MQGTVAAPYGGVGGVVQQPVAAPLPVMAVTYQQTNVDVNNQGLGSRYNIKAGQATGWVQLLCGIAALILGIVKVVAPSNYGYFSFSVIGYGIWGFLLFFLPAGILGIVSKNKNGCVIVAYMVMSILSAMVAVIVLSFGIIDALLVSYGERVADILMLIVGLTEFVTAIVASAYCCAGVCCGRPTQQAVTMHYANQPLVVGSTSPYNQQQVVAPYGGQPVVSSYPMAAGPSAPGYTYPTQPTYPQGGYPQDGYPNQPAMGQGAAQGGFPNQPTMDQQQYQQYGQGAPPPEYNLVAEDYPQKQAMT